MSPDQYKTHPFVKRMVEASNGLTQAFPHLAHHIINQGRDFRGLTMFLGDTADIVLCLKTFGLSGEPLIMWSSGDDPLMALINLDKKVGLHEWREDSKAEYRPTPKAPASKS